VKIWRLYPCFIYRRRSREKYPWSENFD